MRLGRRGRRVVALAATLMLVPGCWIEVSGGAGNRRFNTVGAQITRAEAGALAVDWRVPIAGSTTEPVVDGRLLFVVTSDIDQATGRLGTFAVQAYDRETGTLAWEHSLLPGGQEVSGGASPVSVIDGALWLRYSHDLLAPCTGRLLRLDPATGAVLSDDETGEAIAGPVLASDSVVAHWDGCGDSTRIIVKDMATRATRWTSDPLPAGFAMGEATIAGDHIVVSTGFVRDDGESLVGYALGGCGAAVCPPDWSVDDPAGRARFDRPVAGPDGLVYSTKSQPGAWAIEAREGATGALRWRSVARYSTDLPVGAPGIAVTDDTLYVSGAVAGGPGEPGTLDAYPAVGCGAATCSPDWSIDLGAEVFARGRPIAAAGVVWLGTTADSGVAPAVLGVDAGGCGAATCTPFVRVPLAESGGGAFVFRSGPYQMALTDGHMYVASFPGTEGSELMALSG